MRIVLVGHAGAGKTALLACAAAHLGRPDVLNAHAGVRDRGRLGRSARAARDGRPFPPGRTVRTIKFTTGDHGAFTCVDPGGRWWGPSAGKVTTAFLQALDGADAVVLVADAGRWHDDPGTGVSEARTLAVALRRRLSGLDRVAPVGGALPVVLALTHYDRVPDVGDVHDVAEPLGALRATGAAGTRVDGLTLPVACRSDGRNAEIALLWCLRAHPQAAARADALMRAAWPSEGRYAARSWDRDGWHVARRSA